MRMLKDTVAKWSARYGWSRDRECLFCERKISHFLPYRGGWRSAPPLMRSLQIVGSDLDSYLCPVCGCNDRERHLLLYLRESGLLGQMKGRSVLHFAPELWLTGKIAEAGPVRHLLADLFPARSGVEKIDMLAIAFPEASFDFVIANHVLEHVEDDAKALAEIARVLKPGGSAILQTPYSDVLEHTLSDPGVRTTEARLQLYGQEDHARLYGRDIFRRIAATGFVPKVQRHDEVLAAYDCRRYGLNRVEPFFLFERIRPSAAP